MNNYYIPYSGKEPAVVNIKGHNFLIISDGQEFKEQDLETLGADNVVELERPNSPDAQLLQMQHLAETTAGGIIVADGEMSVEEVIEGLEGELQWIH